MIGLTKKIVAALALTGCVYGQVAAQGHAEKMAATVSRLWTDTINFRPGQSIRWSYDRSVITTALEKLWYNTGNPKYFDMIKYSMDAFIGKDGSSILTYDKEDYNIDEIATGRSLITLYKVTGEAKYYKAASLLRDQLVTHPRTKEGGFWHKKIYPWQMWLDGLYMGEPFYADWAATFHEDTIFNDVANQFVWMEKHARDAKTGLLYHGWDESKEQLWANKTTGLSPHFWARAMGWYGMALVDVLDFFPENHPRRKELLAILSRFAAASVKVQDASTGLWWDIMDKPNYKENYPEASASCMLVYTLAKSVRKGWLPATYLPAAKKGYAGILQKFIATDANGNIDLDGTVSVSGLGGKPYRDGSFEYYMREKVIRNDAKGIGAFLHCAIEMEMLPTLPLGKGLTITLDNFYNHESRKDITGTPVDFHYVWDEMDHNGFAVFGNVFSMYGVEKNTLKTAPTAATLPKKGIYLIVDPDTEKETASPNYMNEKDANTIYNWVKNGGVLVLMGNDSLNCDFEHFNILSDKFGIHFIGDSKNRVQGSNFAMGACPVPAGHPIFKTAKKLYIKENSTLKLSGAAKPAFVQDGQVFMATAKVGKGTVFAIGDPWLYNEYVDVRKLPAEYDNYTAAHDLVKWLIAQAKTTKK